MIIVTGCAGFIGSHLTERLLSKGFNIIGIDNLSTGQEKFLTIAKKYPNFTFYELNLLRLESILPIFKNVNMVFHLAANADVRFGTDQPKKDLEQNTIATFNVLEAMRLNNVKKIAFSSTGSVYGEHDTIPTPENAPFPIQTSLYGASKVACESMISAYCEGFSYQSWIFRFVSIVGERYTHGHIFDFYKQLKTDSENLFVLGNGKQKKSYLYVHDCIDAIMQSIDFFNEKVNIINLGSDDYCEVNDSIKWIAAHLKMKPKLSYSGGERGWTGDSPFIFLDTKKIKLSGWSPKLTIKEGIVKTVDYLRKNEWIYEKRL
jgi:UDP-glucose 4-epimerase